jgi:hypothetical protein
MQPFDAVNRLEGLDRCFQVRSRLSSGDRNGMENLKRQRSSEVKMFALLTEEEVRNRLMRKSASSSE